MNKKGCSIDATVKKKINYLPFSFDIDKYWSSASTDLCSEQGDDRSGEWEL